MLILWDQKDLGKVWNDFLKRRYLPCNSVLTLSTGLNCTNTKGERNSLKVIPRVIDESMSKLDYNRVDDLQRTMALIACYQSSEQWL